MGVELGTSGLAGRHSTEAAEDSGHAVRTYRGTVEGSGADCFTCPIRVPRLGRQGKFSDTPQSTLAGCLISELLINSKSMYTF